MFHQATKLKPALLLFISILLLWVQIASVTHAAEHPFHQHTEQCDAFLVFEHNASLIGEFAAFVMAAVLAAHIVARQQPAFTRHLRLRTIRAPPVFVTPR